MPSLLDILGYAGNLLDLPGSSVRDLLSGNNPFDQWATPFSSDNRASGRDVLRPFLGENEETGMSGWVSNPMEGVKDIAGFGLEMVADPLNFVSLSPLWRALKGRKAVKGANAAQELANRGRYGYVNPKVLADDYVPNPIAQPKATSWQDEVAGLTDRQDDLLMNASLVGGLDKAGYVDEYDALGRQAGQVRSMNQGLLGYTPAPENPMFPGRELMYHGGHDMSASATAQHPYGVFDLGRLKTGEGNNMFGPGAYKADAESTSAFYRNMVQDILNERAAQAPANTLAQSVANLIDDFGDEFSPELLDSYVSSGAAPEIKGLYDMLKSKDFLGYDMTDPFAVEELADALKSEDSLSKYFQDPEVISALSPFTTDKAAGKARLYGFDAPAGTKDRFLKWENPLSEQPQAVQGMVGDPRRLFTPEQLDLMDRVNVANDNWTAASNRLQAQEYLKNNELVGNTLKEKAKHLGVLRKQAEADVFAAQQQYQALKRSLLDQNIPYDIATGKFKDLNSIDGETIADLLMGSQPSNATLADTMGMKAAGIPGVKNLAGSTGGQTYNYAIWDQDLLNQMRVRTIDGERVPINPMFGPVKAEQRVIPQIADSPLTEVINPMSPQPLPGLAKPAMQGAAYQALARFNSYGGSL